MTELVAIAGALLGVIVGGLLGHFSTAWRFREERKWEIARHKRDKLEELCRVLDEYENSYRKLCGQAVLRLETGKLMDPGSGRIPHAKLNALIQFYATELTEDKKELDKATESFGELIPKVIDRDKISNPQKLKLMQQVLSAHKKIDDLCQKLAKKAAEIVNEEIGGESSNKGFNRTPESSGPAKPGELGGGAG